MDLDSWTDEQLQNVLRWGNARANKCDFIWLGDRIATEANAHLDIGKPNWRLAMSLPKRKPAHEKARKMLEADSKVGRLRTSSEPSTIRSGG